MADYKLTLELRFSQNFFRWGMAALLLGVCAPELASESVTLNTYYPAPSGVYTQMITTTNAYLARDSGDVGIGTASPAHKLDVSGDGNFTTTLNVGSNETVGGSLTVGGSETVGGNATVNGTLQVNSNATVNGVLTVNNNATVTGTLTTNWLTVNQTATFSGEVYANSGVRVVQSVSAAAGGAGSCGLVHWASDGANVGLGCGGYVTNQTGFYSEYVVTQELPGGVGSAFCCPFGPGGVQF